LVGQGQQPTPGKLIEISFPKDPPARTVATVFGFNDSTDGNNRAKPWTPGIKKVLNDLPASGKHHCVPAARPARVLDRIVF